MLKLFTILIYAFLINHCVFGFEGDPIDPPSRVDSFTLLMFEQLMEQQERDYMYPAEKVRRLERTSMRQDTIIQKLKAKNHSISRSIKEVQSEILILNTPVHRIKVKTRIILISSFGIGLITIFRMLRKLSIKRKYAFLFFILFTSSNFFAQELNINEKLAMHINKRITSKWALIRELEAQNDSLQLVLNNTLLLKEQTITPEKPFTVWNHLYVFGISGTIILAYNFLLKRFIKI